MGKIRKVTVTIVILVLSAYFLAGLLGALPYQYDYIKQGVAQNQNAFSTGFTIQAQNWTEVTGYPTGMGSFKDSIVYKDNMYVVSSQADNFMIWKVSKSGVWEKKYSTSTLVGIAIDTAKFIQYYDADGNTVLYLIVSSADIDIYYNYPDVPYTEIWGSSDGSSWTSDTLNAKYLPNIPGFRMDCFALNGRYLYIGMHYKDAGINKVQIDKIDRLDFAGGWNTIYSNSHAKVSAMAVFEAPLPNTYTTVWFAIAGYDTTSYAGLYYFDTSEIAKGAVGLQGYYQKEVTAMAVYKDSLFLATTTSLTSPYLSSIYNYSRQPDRTPNPSGTIYDYTSPLQSYEKIKCFGIYNDYLYAGSTSSGVGDIYKMAKRVYARDSWQKIFTTGEVTVHSFTVFNGKFYATTGGLNGNIFVYDEIITYSNPVIQHTPVTHGYLNIPTKITARVSDINGIDEVILDYQVEGRFGRTKPMGLVSGSGDYTSKGYVNGTYSTEIPKSDQPTNITYSITAKNRDGNFTSTATYIISITKERQLTFYGVDYRVLYLIAEALVLIFGYLAYGNDSKPKKKNEWHSG